MAAEVIKLELRDDANALILTTHVPKHNLSGTSAPGSSDDEVMGGYAKGSVWIDGTNGKAYTCVDSTTSAAVWVDQGTVFAGDITGSRDSNAALASLLTALASIGLITDSTTA